MKTATETDRVYFRARAGQVRKLIGSEGFRDVLGALSMFPDMKDFARVLGAVTPAIEKLDEDAIVSVSIFPDRAWAGYVMHETSPAGAGTKLHTF